MNEYTDAEDPRLAGLMMRWLSLREQGLSLSGAELCSTCPELAAELDQRIARIRWANSANEQTRTEVSGTSAPADLGTPERRSASARADYLDLKFHAAGALGEVFLARNAELNREVALKFLKSERTSNPDSVRRFLQEAEITSRLEHPGVVPIYALGIDDGSGPCYAMRFIRGETLQDAIDLFHSRDRDPSGRDPSERSLGLRELLGRFVSICNTMAYAHSRGILHRDLKPRNVMLGKYDETLVVDWGLAKAVDRPEMIAAGEETLPPGSSASRSGRGNDSDTPTLGIVGTPAFMSPEQAEDGSPRVGPPSDIFGLGAILYAILTGRPPYRGGSIAEVLDAVRRCEYLRPRQVEPGVPPALDAICRKAMAARPQNRYALALDLAADVNRWLADEPVRAYPEPIPVRLRRWVRRHPRLVTGASAASAVAVASLLAIAVVVSVANQRLEDANRTIHVNSDQIAAQNLELNTRNEALAHARGEAERERDQAREVTTFLVSAFRKPDPEIDGRALKVADVMGNAVKELRARDKMAPATRASILSAIGETLGGLGLSAESVDVFDQVLQARRQASGADHPDTIKAMDELASACWSAGQYERGVALCEQVLDSRLARLGEKHPDTVESMNNLAVYYEDSGRLDRAIPLFERTVRAHRALKGADHLDTVLAEHNLADAQFMAGHPELALPAFERAVAIYSEKRGPNDPTTLEMTNNLARAYAATGQPGRAREFHERVRKARLDKLGPDHPLTLTSINNIAAAYTQEGRPADAIPLLEAALTVRRKRAGPPHPNIYLAMGNLAIAYHAVGRLDRAIALFEEAVAGQKVVLGDSHFDALKTQRYLAAAYDEAGRSADAERLFRQVVETAGRSKPRNDRFYGDSLSSLGGCLVRSRQFAAALPVLREALEVFAKAPEARLPAAVAEGLLGEALAGQNDFASAEPHLLASQKTIEENRDAIAAPRRATTVRDAYDRLIRFYESTNRPTEAARWKARRPSDPPAPAANRAPGPQIPPASPPAGGASGK
jgi:serine/threonine protein kinase